MARYIDADEFEKAYNAMLEFSKKFCGLIKPNILDLLNQAPTADVQEVKRGEWEFHKKTKLMPSNKVGIKEEYTNGHNCTIVDDKNVNQKIMIMMKRITLKIPICSVCGWCGYDEYNATPYCPNCGARMDGVANG